MLKRTVLVLVALCTLGLFAGCKHEAGESEPSLPGTWYSYEVVDRTVERSGRAVGDIHEYVYTFNADGALTSITNDGETVDSSEWAEDAAVISRGKFRSVTLSDDGKVTKFMYYGEDMYDPENAESFTYTPTENGITVKVGTREFNLTYAGNGVYTWTEEDEDRPGDSETWKFKKAE
ncbi:MAG: hypothetical protein J6Y16_05210 [Treponema sp.]|nr:hypothetical protein [Treponema sp.]